MATKPPKTPDFRSAKTGKFVTQKFAKAHPSTTVKESGPHKKPAPSKKPR